MASEVANAAANTGISIIVPIFNEAAQLPALIDHLRGWHARGCEVILVDGGSADGSPNLAGGSPFNLLQARTGRALQMNVGAQAASGDALVFLHADTRLPANADTLINEVLASGIHTWGRFDARISGGSGALALVASMMNLRSWLTGIATGDQAMFMSKQVFFELDGFPDQPLMEDVELSKRLRRISRPACIRSPAVTSGRRWETRGTWRTIVLMWWLRWSYWRGVDATCLAERYR